MKDWKAIAEKSKELINELKFTQNIIFIHQLESELAALESQEVEGVSAEEWLRSKKYTPDLMFSWEWVIRSLEEYANSSKVTDEMIEKWADEIYGTIHVSGFSLALRLEAIKGAKALRDGLIK